MHPMNHPAFVQFLTYFNGNQDFFECHEVLEDYWKEIAERERKHPLVGYIQLATGLYHWRRGNSRGAKTLLTRSQKLLCDAQTTPFAEKIDYDDLLHQIEQTRLAITEGARFETFSIGITDHLLKEMVHNEIEQLPVIDPDYLLNKHRLRDRTEVIEARELALATKQR